MFQAKVVEEIKIHILCSITFSPRKSCLFEICGKILYRRTGHRRQDGACALLVGYLKLQTHTQNM